MQAEHSYYRKAALSWCLQCCNCRCILAECLLREKAGSLRDLYFDILLHWWIQEVSAGGRHDVLCVKGVSWANAMPAATVALPIAIDERDQGLSGECVGRTLRRLGRDEAAPL